MAEPPAPRQEPGRRQPPRPGPSGPGVGPRGEAGNPPKPTHDALPAATFARMGIHASHFMTLLAFCRHIFPAPLRLLFRNGSHPTGGGVLQAGRGWRFPLFPRSVPGWFRVSGGEGWGMGGRGGEARRSSPLGAAHPVPGAAARLDSDSGGFDFLGSLNFDRPPLPPRLRAPRTFKLSFLG